MPKPQASPARILLASDGSPEAAAATRVAIDISKSSGSELHAVQVARRLPTYGIFLAHATDELLRREAHRALAQRMRDAGGDVVGRTPGWDGRSGRSSPWAKRSGRA